jgi:thiol-disulfide isomerase/thioredoxin
VNEAVQTPPAGARVTTWLLASALVAVLVAWIGQTAMQSTTEEAMLRAAVAVRAQRVDQPLPAAARQFQVELADGRKVPLLDAALREHRVVLLNFWATWCPPCLEEMPSWLRLGSLTRELGIGLVAISYDDDWAAQRKVLAPSGGDALPGGIAWGRDPGGQDGPAEQMLRTRLGTEKLPETWVLVGDHVVGRFVGAQRWDSPEMVRYLQQAARLR